MTTNVPALTIGPVGPVLPDEEDILTGRFGDFQDAFGDDLSNDLTTPVGQLASSESTIVGDVYAAVAQLVAGVDPATSFGRMQDGIGALYFMERDPSQSSVVTLTCSGKTNTPIPINAKARDQAGNIWLCTQAGTIPSGGSIDLTFACQKVGPYPCPEGFVNAIFQSIPGWDSAINAADGVVGNLAESRADFEYRRSQSVALGAVSQTGAILAKILTTPGVLDGWALENPLGVTSGASFIGSITDNVLNVSLMGDGEVEPGQMLLGATRGSLITGYLSGSGGVGTYKVSIRETVASTALTSAVGGIRLVPNSIIGVAYGGTAAAIGAGILRKKNPGCNYNGNTSVQVPDTSTGYSAPVPTYNVKYLIPTPTPVLFAVSMQSGSGVPTNAIALIVAAMIATFTGTDGTAAANFLDASPKARVAGAIFASRYYRAINNLGAWALIYKIQVGLDAANEDSILMRADQIPTLSAGNIAVTFD